MGVWLLGKSLSTVCRDQPAKVEEKPGISLNGRDVYKYQACYLDFFLYIMN